MAAFSNNGIPPAHTTLSMSTPNMPGGMGVVSPSGSLPSATAPNTAVTSNVSDIQYLYKARAKYACK
jgi:hypothetical protein